MNTLYDITWFYYIIIDNISHGLGAVYFFLKKRDLLEYQVIKQLIRSDQFGLSGLTLT